MVLMMAAIGAGLVQAPLDISRRRMTSNWVCHVLVVSDICLRSLFRYGEDDCGLLEAKVDLMGLLG